jgi:predicted nucleic acid-binding protein
MRLFLDANILVAIVNKEYPLFDYASRILSLVNNPKYVVYTSPLCLAIAFYFAEKKSKQTAREKLRILAQNISITDINDKIVQEALQNNAVHDLEDGLEYYADKHANCEVIITEDINDFYFSDLEVLTSKSFFEKYMKVRRYRYGR